MALTQGNECVLVLFFFTSKPLSIRQNTSFFGGAFGVCSQLIGTKTGYRIEIATTHIEQLAQAQR